MSWTSLLYLPTQSLPGATFTATESARLRPCRTIQSMPDTSAGWRHKRRLSVPFEVPAAQPEGSRTSGSTWSPTQTLTASQHRPPCPKGKAKGGPPHQKNKKKQNKKTVLDMQLYSQPQHPLALPAAAGARRPGTPTKQTVLENGAELLFGEKGTQLPQAPC